MPISPTSYKHNRGLGYSPISKVTIIDVLTDPPDVDNSDDEEFYEVPFEYLDDLFNDTYVNTITRSTPSDLPLVYLELIDWDQQGPLALDIYADDNVLLEVLNMHNLEDHTIVHGIQPNGEA